MNEDRPRRMRSPKLTKEQAKELFSVAKELEDQGANEQALILYRQIYYAYNRSEKASRKKMAFLSQKIGVLNATLGNYERALEWLAESYERTVSLQGDDQHVPFELYFDLCLVNYKLEEYSTANEMFEDCLQLAKKIYPEEKELMVLIHQFLGFGYFQKKKMELSQKHLSKALENLNLVKGHNKPFTFYALYEFAEFYLGANDSKKALLFLEQAKIMLYRESFLEDGTREEAMKIHSFYARKFLENFDKESQKFELEKMITALRYKLGDYDGAPDKINLPYQKLSKAEKDPSIHGLLHW